MTKITITPSERPVIARAGGAIIAETHGALILHEDGYEPVIYFPRGDAIAFCDPSEKRSTCPHKGEARYFNVTTKSRVIADAAWSYEAPIDAVAQIAGYIAFGHELVTVETL